MNTIKYLITVLSLVTLFSCEDFFEVTVDLDIPEHESKLAATSILHDNASSNPVLVSYSIGALESTTDNQLISDADIVLSDDVNEYSFELTDEPGIYKYSEPINFIAGKTYELEISAPNYETITATQKFPEEIPIINVEFNPDKIKVRFQDIPDERNYYILELYSLDPNNDEYSSIFIESFGDSSDRSSLSRGILFDDQNFEGEETEMVANHWFENESSENITLKAVLYHVTEDYFRFDRTLNLSDIANENPFVEPVHLHQNFENGYGVFALMNKSEFEFTVE